MTTNATGGRTQSAATINKQLRRALNGYVPALAEKALSKALSGDSTAMLVVTNLLLAANFQEKSK